MELISDRHLERLSCEVSKRPSIDLKSLNGDQVKQVVEGNQTWTAEGAPDKDENVCRL